MNTSGVPQEYEVPLVAYITATVTADDADQAIAKAIDAVYISVGVRNRNVSAQESGPIGCEDSERVYEQED